MWPAGPFQGALSDDETYNAHKQELELAYMEKNDKTAGHPKPDGECPAEVDQKQHVHSI